MNSEQNSLSRPLDACGYLASKGWEDYVSHELGPHTKRYGRLFFKEGPPVACHWAQNIWLNPQVITFKSIPQAIAALQQLGNYWVAYSEILPDMVAAINRGLAMVPWGTQVFLTPKAAPKSGSFTILNQTTLVAATDCTSPFPGGNIVFKENKKDPPSTAYLKLWEAFTRLKQSPGPGSFCLDAGACPGGWTWVLDQLGAETLALDRSPLAPQLMASPRVRFRSGNAFAIGPQQLKDFGWTKLDWLCSDLICYPEKLLTWVNQWLESGLVDNLVITLKMQGKPDWATIKAFSAIPGSQIYHGSYNKHELTWLRPHQ